MKTARGLKALACLLALLSLTACGYRIARPPLESIKLGRIDNRTMEMALEDKLYAALRRELAKRGLGVEAEAGYELTGSINEYKLKATAERDQIAIQYELTVIGSFRLQSPSGKVVPLVPGGSYIVGFGADVALDYLMAARQRADEQAAKNMAEGIVAALMALDPAGLTETTAPISNTPEARP